MRELEKVKQAAGDLHARLAKLEKPKESTQPAPPGMELPSK